MKRRNKYYSKHKRKHICTNLKKIQMDCNVFEKFKNNSFSKFKFTVCNVWSNAWDTKLSAALCS